MQSRPAYATVGLFVILLTGAVIVAGVWFGFGDPKPPSGPYLTYVTDSVAGMRVNSTVRYRGVDVGRVREIRLDPDDPRRVRLRLDIDLGVPILTDTVARIAAQGLTGLSYIELSSDGSGTPLEAQEGEAYPVIQSQPTLFGNIDAAGTELLARVDEVALQLAEAARRISALFDETNREAVAATLADLRAVAAVLGARADGVGQGVDDLGSVLADAARAGEKLPGLVDRADRTLAGIDRHAATLAEAARAVERLAVTVEAESQRLGGGLDRAASLTEQELTRFASETQPALTAMLHELEGAAGALRRLGEALERDPSLLLYGRRDRPLGPGEGTAR